MAKTPRGKRRTLLVALGTTDAASKPLLRKAIDLANRFQASLRLLHVSAPTYAFVPGDLKQQTNELRALLDKVDRRTDADITADVVRDYPVADAIVRQVLKYKPDMLIAESHRRGKFSRMLMNQTDWELIRHCPCPLWLSKSARLPRELRILAAIDPFHGRVKSSKLEDVILRTAFNVANDRREQVIVCHAYTPPSSVMPAMAGELYWQPLSEKELRRYEASIRKAIKKRLARYQIPSRNELTLPGDPATVLAHTAKKYRASVIVMGAISRSALKRFFIGNTAERVVDEVECDLLVVKPAGFRTQVPRSKTRLVLGYPAVARADPALFTHLRP